MNARNILPALAFLVSLDTSAQLSPELVDIPMRDGEVLSGHLYRPDTINTYPTILIQTPYGKFWYQNSGLPLVGMDLVNSNYTFVIVDWRCFWGSIGACNLSFDRGEDGYDAVEWIAQQPWSDGQVGTWGPSALGNIQFTTAREHPPHLVCAVPEVTGVHFKYDSYHPGGALRTEYLETLNSYFGSYDPVINNPYYNLLWQITENSTLYPDEIEVPMLLIGGWYDHNIHIDLPLLDTLRQVSHPSVRDQHKILIGPWVHGGTGQADLGSTQQGELSYPMAENENEAFALEFFDFHMRGINNGWDARAPITFFNMGENVWDTTSAWPPMDAAPQVMYLQNDNSILPTTSPLAQFTYLYDPQDPSPTIGGKTLSFSLDQGPYDQSDSVETRNDMFHFSTPVLTQPLMVQGRIKVNLYVSSDRADTDFAVRLTEVYPDGRSMLLLDHIQRMRFRNGYTPQDTAAMMPGTIYPITLELDDIATTFQTGNRLRLIISSSNYPRYNRNMNTNDAMYPNSNIDTLVNPLVATNSIHIGGATPSSIELPVVPDPSMAVEVPAVEQKIRLYPNPTRGLVILTGVDSDAELVVVDLQGRELVRSSTTEQNSQVMDLRHLSTGTYLIQVFNADLTTWSEKVLLIDR